MNELSKNELMEVEGGQVGEALTLIDVVYDMFTGEGWIGQLSQIACYYRSQMPSNWTGHGY